MIVRPLDERHDAELLFGDAAGCVERRACVAATRVDGTGSVEIPHDGGRVVVTLDIDPHEESPSALLRATAAGGDVLGEARVSPGFKLTRARAGAWAEAGFSAQAAR